MANAVPGRMVIQVPRGRVDPPDHTGLPDMSPIASSVSMTAATRLPADSQCTSKREFSVWAV